MRYGVHYRSYFNSDPAFGGQLSGILGAILPFGRANAICSIYIIYISHFGICMSKSMLHLPPL